MVILDDSKRIVPSAYSDVFEEFWKLVPYKIGKGAAWAAWTKAIKKRAAPADIIAGVQKLIWYELRRKRQDAADFPQLASGGG